MHMVFCQTPVHHFNQLQAAQNLYQVHFCYLNIGKHRLKMAKNVYHAHFQTNYDDDDDDDDDVQ